MNLNSFLATIVIIEARNTLQNPLILRSTVAKTRIFHLRHITIMSSSTTKKQPLITSITDVDDLRVQVVKHYFGQGESRGTFERLLSKFAGKSGVITIMFVPEQYRARISKGYPLIIKWVSLDDFVRGETNVDILRSAEIYRSMIGKFSQPILLFAEHLKDLDTCEVDHIAWIANTLDAPDHNLSLADAAVSSASASTVKK
jgi:hypothetical protein